MNKTMKDMINGNKTRSLKISILLLFGFITLSFFGCSEITAPADVFPPESPKNFRLLGGGDGQGETGLRLPNRLRRPRTGEARAAGDAVPPGQHQQVDHGGGGHAPGRAGQAGPGRG